MAVLSLKNKSKQSFLTAPSEIDLGAMIPLMTTTLSTSAASVTFSDIPQNYEHLQVRMIARSTAATNSAGLLIRYNSDSGSNYSWHYLFGDGTTAGGGGGTSTTFSYCGFIGAASLTTGIFGSSIIDILDYTNANKYKTMRALSGTDTNNTNGALALYSGGWRNTNAVTSIDLLLSTGNFAQYSQAALYGIKRAGV